jgi:hypothetical protein
MGLALGVGWGVVDGKSLGDTRRGPTARPVTEGCIVGVLTC